MQLKNNNNINTHRRFTNILLLIHYTYIEINSQILKLGLILFKRYIYLYII